MRNFLIAIGAAAIFAASLAQAAEGPFYIHRPEVNLRETPNGEIILVFDVDDKVFVIESKGDWSYVSAPGLDVKGWVWNEYYGTDRIGEPGTAPQNQQNLPRPAIAISSPQPGLITNVVISQGIELAVLDDPIKVTQPVKTPSTPRSETGFIADANPPTSPQTPVIQPATEPPKVMLGTPKSSAADITIPAMLGAGFIPIGGNDIALIRGENVNIRSDSSTGSEIVGNVNNGDKGYVVATEDTWYLLSFPAKDIKGWVHGDFVNQLPRVEITGSDVRLRERPSLSGRVKIKLAANEVFHEFERRDGWILVASSASGLKGWVHGEYVSETKRMASRPYKVTGDEVNFRSSPAVDAVILSALTEGTEVQVLGRNDRWSFIEHSGQQGWMYSQYLDPNFVNAPKTVYGKSIGTRMIARAKDMAGTPYVWGGESDSGVDCSGLIYKLLVDEGADTSHLPRRASTQMAGLGSAVDKENLAPGDLVFFTTYQAGASHVGIYLGDGDFIHASSAKGKVTISNMSEGYYKRRFVGARRISEAELTRLK